MNKAEKERVREFLPDYLRMKGLPTEKLFRCINPEHEDKHPSMSFDSARCKVHCFACGVTYDIYDCISILEGLVEMKDVFAFAAENFLGKKPILSNKKSQQQTFFDLSRLSMSDEGYKYLSLRGISKETADKFKIVYCNDYYLKFRPNDPHWKAVIIPTGEKTFTVRNINSSSDKDRIRKVGGSPIFNLDVLYEDKRSPVFVTEGELDAISFYEANADAVALGSVTNTRLFLNIIRSNVPKRKIILCLDNDEKGKEYQSILSSELSSMGISFEEINVAGNHKDINDALAASISSFTETVNNILSSEEYKENQSKELYKHRSVLDLLSTLKSETFVSTSFKQLDTVLGGGLYNGLYILGGSSSVGKTSFALQLADQIACAGTDILFFTLEMSSHSMVAKSLSRISCFKDVKTAMSAREITSVAFTPTKAQETTYNSAVKHYSSYANHIYMTEGNSTAVSYIISSIKEHIQLTGKNPVVFIDYLQLLESDSRSLSDKQNINACVRDLKRATREFKIPMIAISSFNRSGYKEEAAFESFKESGNIEYSADVLLALQLKGISKKNFNINDEKKKPVREIELVVLKNRYGVAGEKISYSYMPKFDIFKEL